jgi:hypothetical protein
MSSSSARYTLAASVWEIRPTCSRTDVNSEIAIAGGDAAAIGGSYRLESPVDGLDYAAEAGRLGPYRLIPAELT